EAVTRLSAKDLSRANREQIIHGLLTQYTEEAQLAEHVLGRSWAAASPEDRSKFEDRFGAYMVAMCAGMLKDVPGDVKFVVKGEQPQGDRVVVHTAFVDSGGESTVVDWTVAHTGDGHLYLTDAATDGVSFIQ